MSFNVNDLMGGQVDIENVATQSDTEVQAGSTSHHMNYIRNRSRGSRGIRQIPNAEQQLKTKQMKDVQKYLIFGLVLYVLCG